VLIASCCHSGADQLHCITAGSGRILVTLRLTETIAAGYNTLNFTHKETRTTAGLFVICVVNDLSCKHAQSAELDVTVADLPADGMHISKFFGENAPIFLDGRKFKIFWWTWL